MAQMNSHLTDVETVFLPGAVGNAFVSSSLIKEVAALGGDVRGLVPDAVHEQLVTPSRPSADGLTRRVTRFAPSRRRRIRFPRLCLCPEVGVRLDQPGPEGAARA